ncbi:putative quinate utilization pathway activator [Diaporthe ampelina]|uniref:Putative quinate utilization pathway activator n=1 Tax=Diaporthe ampelina TaxID=1214573 RepID=A0A0G2H314_9PEZI|nr:putative quinate utilization pathway activator [Diaporthe ampelina]
MQLPAALAASGSKAQAETPSTADPGFPTDELCSRALINILVADYLCGHTRVQGGRWERLTCFGRGELREVNFEALIPLEVDDQHILKDSILGAPSFTRALSRLDRSETVNANSLRSLVDADREPAGPRPGARGF